MTAATEPRKRHRNRWSAVAWSIAAALLLTPLVAMQFTTEVNWSGSDFVVFGAMLGTALGTCELALRSRYDRRYKLAVGIAVAAAFLLVWINAAVGIVGDERNPANLAFYAVPVLALAGAAVARFRPRGTAVAMVVAAGAQGLAAVNGAMAGTASGLPLAPLAGLTVVFAGMWLLSAALFGTSRGSVR